MDISGITSESTAAPSGVSTPQLDQQDFFTLLTTQLKAQNPLEPMEDQQFLGELANFANLEQTSRVNDNLLGLAVLQQNLALTQQLTQGAQLIGHHVEYLDAETGELATGTVRAVRLGESGVNLDVDGTQVSLQAITALTEGGDSGVGEGDESQGEGEDS